MKTTDDLLLDKMIELNNRESSNVGSITKKVLILSTPRSGSSLFCDVLNNTGKAGDCAEWFNNRYMAAYGKMTNNPNVNFNDYLNFIMSKTVGDTGVFVVNAHIEHMMFFAKQKVNLLQLGFDLIVYVYREDKVAQAISLTKSRLTDSWSSDVKGDQASLSKVNNAIIVDSLKHIVDSDTVYNEQLKKFTKAEFAYEDFRNLSSTKAFAELIGLIGAEYEGE